MKVHAGVWSALAAAGLFGLSTPLAKILLANISPLMLAACLYMGSGLGLCLLLLVRLVLSGAPLAVPRGRDFLWLLSATAVGGALGPYLLMRGLSMADSASTALALNLEGIFTAVLAWFVFRENFDRRIIVGMGLIVSGSMCLSLGSAAMGASIGLLLTAAACLCWAIDNNLTRKVSGNDALLIATFKGLVAGCANLMLALESGDYLPAPADLLKSGVLGFVGYGLSLVCFVVALRHLGTARTGAYFSLAPFMGALLAVMLGAPLTWMLVLAAILMGTGVCLHLREAHSHWHRHEPLRHSHSHRHDVHHQHAHSRLDPEGEPHTHEHTHDPLEHDHVHFPDVHHLHH
jgi:drug/metabolite transporter (DMT)-like permease